MVQKIVQTLIDDIDGSLAEHTIPFSLNGIEYSIDLSNANAAAMQRVMEPWITHAQRTGGRKSTKGPLALTTTPRRNLTAVREWALDNGIEVADRGRISADVMAQYDKARESSPVVAVPDPEPASVTPIKATSRGRAAKKVDEPAPTGLKPVKRATAQRGVVV